MMLSASAASSAIYGSTAQSRWESVVVTKASEEAELHAFAEQMETATQMVQQTIGRMLRESEIHPHLVVLAVARVAGELMGALAAASGHDLEEVLKDSTEIVQQAARNHYGEVQAVTAELMPVAGNA